MNVCHCSPALIDCVPSDIFIDGNSFFFEYQPSETSTMLYVDIATC